MKNLYVDITELESWQGRLTGVPRVMSELSLRFRGQNKKPIFVSWDGKSKKYIQVEEYLVLSRKSSGKENLSQLDNRKASQLSNKTKNLIKKSPLLTNVARRAQKFTKKNNNVISEDKFVNIKAGDVLFVLCDWHGSDQAFIDILITLNKRGVKLAHMAYDLLPIVTPQYSGHATDSLINYSKAVYPLCDVMFSISKNTKRDIKRWLTGNELGVPEIDVIRLGDDFEFAKPIKPTSKFFENKRKFILCVGTIEARKNHALLYYTYKLAAQKGLELPSLIIVGRRGWKTDDIYELITNDPETNEKFVFLENTADEELSWLYDNCLFTVYPSFYEGWGLPIAESAARAVPCICSNTSSMPEVAGKYVKYFSPFSATECLSAITDMMNPKTLSSVKENLREYTVYGWDDTFRVIKNKIGQL